jgi:hypothetical protein
MSRKSRAPTSKQKATGWTIVVVVSATMLLLAWLMGRLVG